MKRGHGAYGLGGRKGRDDNACYLSVGGAYGETSHATPYRATDGHCETRNVTETCPVCLCEALYFVERVLSSQAGVLPAFLRMVFSF